MQPYKVCPQCQTPTDLSATVCTNCGRELNTQAPPPNQTVFTQGGPSPYEPAYAPVDSSKKIAAGICGILLGGLGIHKFILGYTQAGIIMLVVSLVVSIPTCGIAYLVMQIIGVIEGIIYLSKSDNEFQQTYQVGKKEWF